MRKILLTIGCIGLMACCCVPSIEAQRGGRSGSSQEQTSRRPSSGSSSTTSQQGATVSRRPSSGSSSTTSQQGVTVSRRPASGSSSSSQKAPSSTVGNRRPGSEAATVVERHNRDNAASSTGGRGQWRDDKHPSNAPHPGYTHQSPPPPGYHANRVPPHGYRFTPPPPGLGCAVGYNVYTAPPPRAHFYTLHGVRYYFYDQCFHALINGMYQVVAAPLGLIVPMLPAGCELLLYNNVFYYYYDGTFYRPMGTGYEVVAPRIGMTVPYLPNYGVSYVMYRNRPAYYYNGYYYYEQEAPAGVVYRVVGMY